MCACPCTKLSKADARCLAALIWHFKCIWWNVGCSSAPSSTVCWLATGSANTGTCDVSCFAVSNCYDIMADRCNAFTKQHMISTGSISVCGGCVVFVWLPDHSLCLSSLLQSSSSETYQSALIVMAQAGIVSEPMHSMPPPESGKNCKTFKLVVNGNVSSSNGHCECCPFALFQSSSWINYSATWSPVLEVALTSCTLVAVIVSTVRWCLLPMVETAQTADIWHHISTYTPHHTLLPIICTWLSLSHHTQCK